MASAITVVCPHCNHRMRASSEHLGRKGRCPACKALVEIKATGEESMPAIRPTVSSESTRKAIARGSSTAVAGWQSGLIGAVVTVVLYLAVFLPLEGTYLGQLFLARGPMPYFITLVTCWGLAMLAMKYLAVKKQTSIAELELELIPLEIGLQITSSNVDQFLDHLVGLPSAQRRSILGRRIEGALEHFKSRNSVPEVQEYLATQSEIDASGVDSGYTLLRAFIWAIPILGFIGTVMGIGTAVSGLDASINQNNPSAVAADSGLPVGDEDPEPSDAGGQLMKGLGQVTAGLATAFDTTLIALVMAIVLLFPTESLRGTEYAMLDQIEAFANESLLRRMSDDQRELSDEELPEVVRDALKSAFQEHQRWLAQWQAQVAQLGQIVGADFETIVGRVQEQVSAVEAGRVEKYESLGRVLEDIFDKAGQATLSWHQAEQDARSRTEEFLGALSQFQDTLGGITKLCGDISVEQNRMWEMYSEGNLNNSMLSLAEQVAKLAERLDGSEKVMDKTRLLGGSQPRAVADLPPDGTEPIQVIEPTVGKSSSQQQGVFGRLWGRRR